MKIKGIIFEDMVNYKKISMTIMMPKCDFKCDRECGLKVCQNLPIANDPDIDIDFEQVLKKYYLNNDITESIVFQGLEPFDTFDDLYEAITIIRKYTDDDIVIYTGYNENEITKYTTELKKFCNIIIKYGRYIPDNPSHLDDTLGVQLASPNQYARLLS